MGCTNSKKEKNDLIDFEPKVLVRTDSLSRFQYITTIGGHRYENNTIRSYSRKGTYIPEKQHPNVLAPMARNVKTDYLQNGIIV